MKLINFKNLLLLPALALPILLFSQESDQEEVNPYEVLLDAINKNADVEKQFDIKRFNTIEAKVIELRNKKLNLLTTLEPQKNYLISSRQSLMITSHNYPS